MSRSLDELVANYEAAKQAHETSKLLLQQAKEDLMVGCTHPATHETEEYFEEDYLNNAHSTYTTYCKVCKAELGSRYESYPR